MLRMFPVVANSEDSESQDNSSWKWPQEVSSPTSWSKRGQLWGQTRLLRAFSSQVLKSCKNGAGTASLGSLHHYLAVLMEKRFSSLLSTYAHYFWLSHPAPSWGAQLWLLVDSLQPLGGCKVPQRCLLSRPNQPSYPSTSWPGKCSSPQCLGGVSAELLPVNV